MTARSMIASIVLEVVRRDQHDAPDCRETDKPSLQRIDRAIVEARERLVEQHQARLVEQRALEREALPHAARESGDRIVDAAR